MLHPTRSHQKSLTKISQIFNNKKMQNKSAYIITIQKNNNCKQLELILVQDDGYSVLAHRAYSYVLESTVMHLKTELQYSTHTKS